MQSYRNNEIWICYYSIRDIRFLEWGRIDESIYKKKFDKYCQDSQQPYLCTAQFGIAINI